jgi:hypothetical protein
MLESQYEEQFTVFVDFLGFRETEFSSPQRILSILSTLQEITKMSSDARISSRHGSMGLYPAITAFSDNVVLSIPLSQTQQDLPNKVMWLMCYFLGKISTLAFDLGFLIRGGAAIGNLYHSSGVIFGKALVDAYKLESETAIYPRVVLSPSILSRREWQAALFPHEVDRDFDGVYHFNYQH